MVLPGADRYRASARMPPVYLCRHGETVLNSEGRLRGLSNVDLNDVGRREAHALGLTLQPMKPGVIMASPLGRTQQTAEAIGGACGLTPEVCDHLLDRDYGPQNGRPADEVIETWGSVDNAPGVEPWDSVVKRARSALAEAAVRSQDGPVVLVSHDAVNSALLAFLDSTRWPDPRAVRQPTGCLNVLWPDNDTWVVLIAGLRPAPIP